MPASFFIATIAAGLAEGILMAGINPKILDWFDKRGISAETVLRTGTYSGGRVGTGGEVQASDTGNIIVFPFIENEEEIGASYRTADKKFWQRAGAKKTFFNADILSDPLLESGPQALVITEGQMDALTVLECGYPFVVSVPDGAPPARDKDGNIIQVPASAAGIDPNHDDKYRFIFNNWERLKRIRRIIIATDSDEPGQRLAAELVRRLGRPRCLFVTYPEGSKDLNEVLLAHGAPEVARIIFNARPYPVSGVYKLSEFPPEPELRPVSTGWNSLNKFLKPYYPAFMVVTGLAGSGKSTWTNQLVAQLAARHGWPVAIASFEMRVRPYVTDTLTASYLDRGKAEWNELDILDANAWIENRFVFIAPDPEDDENHDILWLIERATTAVLRYGIRVLLVDPWNELDHNRMNGENESDYVGRAIKDLKSFGRRHDCLVIVVAHPTKEGATGKTPDKIGLYDVASSANFANKADLGIVIARIGDSSIGDSMTSVLVKKVRYQPDAGSLGSADFVFDKEKRLFVE